MRIKMLTSYRDFYKPGDVVDETDSKARELVARGSAVEVEKAAPINKEVQTEKVVKPVCPLCGRQFASKHGLKLHTAKSHK